MAGARGTLGSGAPCWKELRADWCVCREWASVFGSPAHGAVVSLLERKSRAEEGDLDGKSCATLFIAVSCADTLWDCIEQIYSRRERESVTSVKLKVTIILKVSSFLFATFNHQCSRYCKTE